MKKLYTIKELAVKYGVTFATISTKLKKHNIAYDANKKGSGGARLFSMSDVSDILDKSSNCECCGEKFTKVRNKDKYCSRGCYLKELYKRQNKGIRKPRNKLFTHTVMGDFLDGDKSYCTKKGIEDNRKIMECSVDCLLDELGDIE